MAKLKLNMWPNRPRRNFAADGAVQGNKMRNMEYFIKAETFSLLHRQTNKHMLADHCYDVSNAPLSYKRTSLLTVYCPATRQHEN